MTVKDIILDLEDCITFNHQPNKELLENAVELMKHQKAENERLKEENKILSRYEGNIQAEAYKEFAKMAIDRVEKAKAKYQRLCKEQGEEMEEHMHIHFNGITKIINNLLKEKVGADNG